MRSPFWQLLRKELRHSLVPVVFFTGACILVYSVPFFVPGLHGIPLQETGWIFVITAPLQALPFWLLWRSVAVWRREWAGNHMLLLLSLPVRGWQIIGAKLASLFLEIALYGVITAGALYRYLVPELSLRLKGHFTVFLWFATGVLYVTVLIVVAVFFFHFAMLAGRLVRKAGWLVSAAALFTGIWAALRVGGLLSPLLQWLPRIPLKGMNMSPGRWKETVMHIQMAPLVGFVLVLAFLFWLSARWVERDLEA